jgi:23S rRNA pseudouridine1911/1915/1917 synthase
MDFTIPAAYDTRTVGSYLSSEIHISTRLLRALKQHPTGILLNGQHVTVRALLHTGDRLQLAIEQITPAQPGAILPVAPQEDVPIVYEDEDIMVCAKPPYMPTHPSHGHFTDTLANAIAAYEQARGQGNPFVFHPVNRLDRNTSGLVLIARHALSAQRLGEAMTRGDIRKTYLALLRGAPTPEKGRIATGIRRAQESIILREVTPLGAPDAADALTDYHTLPVFHSTLPSLNTPLSLVCAKPLTGRTHQLRLHFAHLGTPILGDDWYGDGIIPGILERHALHSYALTFPHPRTGESMTLYAPLPSDLRALLPPDLDLDDQELIV